ncbi:hypothetical protein FACS189487_02420 [Campylobacterota bacterium]|nr:hypothetical protein FACS189487_02420 [Campylobacterota bacterium]
MKYAIKFILVFCTAAILSANEITILESSDREMSYTIAPAEPAKKSLSVNAKTSEKSANNESKIGENAKKYRYFLYGDPEREAISHGSVIVGFKNEADISPLADRYNLKNPQRIGESLSFVFDNHSELDDLSLCAKIYEESPHAIDSASPNWTTNIEIK